MYAVIRTGGKQYRVQAGDSIRVEKLDRELGAEFDLTDILMVGGDTAVIGQPVVKNAAVAVVVTKQTKDRKVLVFKKKRRQGYRRLKGHRQCFTELFVRAISLDGKETRSDKEARVVDVEQVRKAKIAARSKKGAVAASSMASPTASPMMATDTALPAVAATASPTASPSSGSRGQEETTEKKS